MGEPTTIWFVVHMALLVVLVVLDVALIANELLKGIRRRRRLKALRISRERRNK
jgi:hypothetical protein